MFFSIFTLRLQWLLRPHFLRLKTHNYFQFHFSYFFVPILHASSIESPHYDNWSACFSSLNDKHEPTLSRPKLHFIVIQLCCKCSSSLDFEFVPTLGCIRLAEKRTRKRMWNDRRVNCAKCCSCHATTFCDVRVVFHLPLLEMCKIMNACNFTLMADKVMTVGCVVHCKYTIFFVFVSFSFRQSTVSRSVCLVSSMIYCVFATLKSTWITSCRPDWPHTWMRFVTPSLRLVVCHFIQIFYRLNRFHCLLLLILICRDAKWQSETEKRKRKTTRTFTLKTFILVKFLVSTNEIFSVKSAQCNCYLCSCVCVSISTDTGVAH